MLVPIRLLPGVVVGHVRVMRGMAAFVARTARPPRARLGNTPRERGLDQAARLPRRSSPRSARPARPGAPPISPYPYSRDSSPQKSRRIKSTPEGRGRSITSATSRGSRWTSSCRSAGGRSPCSKQRPHERLCPIWQSLSRYSHRTSNATKQPLSSCAASPARRPNSRLSARE